MDRQHPEELGSVSFATRAPQRLRKAACQCRIEGLIVGTRNGPYKEDFPEGTVVRIRDLAALTAFRKEWRLHHPLGEDQLGFAGQKATVKRVSSYHGGDELYELDGISGTWHERCLQHDDG
jgi:hypothetical protein